jgi:hypothetical protein
MTAPPYNISLSLFSLSVSTKRYENENYHESIILSLMEFFHPSVLLFPGRREEERQSEEKGGGEEGKRKR